MKNIFRVKGLAAFIVIFGGLVAGLVFFADDLVEKGLEAAGTRAVGARVELADVDLSLFPAGLTLHAMQITNPDAPMTNAAEIARLAVAIEPLPLLEKKVHIPEMTVAGLRFNTERAYSGAIARKKKAAAKPAEDEGKKSPRFQLPDFDQLDVDKILARESLQSLEEIEKLKQTAAEKRAAFQKRLEELPDKDKMRQYESRVKSLGDREGLAGIAGGIQEAAAIKKEIQADLDRLRQARQEVTTSLDSLQKQVQTVARSPQQDVQRLTEKYSLSPQGLGNLTGLLFGPKIQHWLETGLAWYDKLQPVLAAAGERGDGEAEVKPVRGRGVTVKFADKTAAPDFWIAHTEVSAATRAGDIAGTIENITTQQPLLGRPLTYRFTGQQLEKLDSLDIDGRLDHVRPDQPEDTLNVRARGWGITDLAVSRDQAFPVILDQGRVDSRLEAAIEKRVLSSQADFAVSDADFSLVEKESSNALEQSVAAALADISRFSIQAKVSGPLDDYRVSVSSDLDKVMKKAVSGVVADQAKEFENRLQAVIAEKTDGPLAELRSQVNGLGGIEKELTQRLNIGQNVLQMGPSSGGTSLPFGR
ncbi:MAG: TIGR03545 family protein [Desulfosudaceae bacterium]